MLEISVFRHFAVKSRLLLMMILLTAFQVKSVNGQSDQSSYSVFGVGNLNWSGYAHNTAMGGLGIGYNTRFFFNDQNPALLGTNYEAVFQLGTALDYRSITDGNDTYSSVTGGFKEFALSAPLVYGKWNFGLSLTPYSTVSYGFTQERSGPEGNSTFIDVTGRGGIDVANLSTSLKLGNLSLGLKGTYYFGIITNEQRFTLENISSSFATTTVEERRSFGDIALSGGLYYQIKLSDNRQINLGAYYNPSFNLDQTTLVTFQNESSSGSVSSTDTLTYDKGQGRSIRIPERIGFGLAYQKSRAFGLGLDVQLQNWKSYQNENGSTENYYGESLRLALGAEIIPNIEQPTKLFNVTSFRFGFHYEQTPFLINNESVNDFGINFGASLPLNSFWGMSHVTMGVTLGQRGNISTVGLIRENYLKLNLGFSLQDLTWFTKQRFN